MPICLKADPERDVQTHVLKHRKVFVLKKAHGGSMVSHTSVTICGQHLMRASAVVLWKERHRVTCRHCVRNMLYRFPAQINERSGMSMPRPA
jgi:hypothetical protein